MESESYMKRIRGRWAVQRASFQTDPQRRPEHMVRDNPDGASTLASCPASSPSPSVSFTVLLTAPFHSDVARGLNGVRTGVNSLYQRCTSASVNSDPRRRAVLLVSQHAIHILAAASISGRPSSAVKDSQTDRRKH